MKNYENFDNSFFLKLICIIAAIALLFVIAVSIIGIFAGDSFSYANDSDAETFIFADSSDDTEEIKDTDTDPLIPPPETNTEQETNTEAIDSNIDTEAIQEDSTDTEADIPAVTPTVLEETEDMGQDYIDKIIFVGDSTTYGLQAYKMLSDGKNTKQVWTSSSRSLSLSDILTKKIIYPQTGKEMTIREATALAKPEYMILTIGVEGVAFLDEAGFKAEYKGLALALKEASPDTKFMLQSIFPVSSDYKSTSKLNNDKINAANEWIKEIASQIGFKYLDTQSVLKNSEGVLNPDYDNGGNGINLNDRGFTAVLKYIRTHGYK